MLRRAKVSFNQSVERLGGLFPRATQDMLSRQFPLLFKSDTIIAECRATFKVPIRIPREVLWAITEFVNSGDVVADVGANFGSASCVLAHRVGHGGKVHCFEPGPPFLQKLKHTIEQNQSYAPVFHIHPIGLSERSGRLKWKEDPEEPGHAQLTGRSGTEVEVTTLDDVALGSKWDRLAFVKIEVEGMEYEVLKGSQKTLRQHRPVVLFESLMEFEQYRKKRVRKMAGELLADLGYELFAVTGPTRRERVSYPYFASYTLALPH